MTTQPKNKPATLNREKLAEAVELAIAILDDLETEIEYPSVTVGMAYRSATDNAKQLLETLIEAGQGDPQC
jgi:hypothetical protein